MPRTSYDKIPSQFQIRLDEEDARALVEFAKAHKLSYNKAVGKLLRIAISKESHFRAFVRSPELMTVIMAAALRQGGMGAVLRAAADADRPEDWGQFQTNLLDLMPEPDHG